MKFSKLILFVVCILLSQNVYAMNKSLPIDKSPDGTFYMNVFDYRPETLSYMQKNNLQGGGPTWKALITAAVKIKQLNVLARIEMDDESDVVLITSKDKEAIETVKEITVSLMNDIKFRDQCVLIAKKGGYLE